MNLKEQVEAMQHEQPWMYRFRLSEDLFTPGPEIKGPKNVMKTQVIQSLQLEQKRVLDVGCGEGLFSFYMAAEGAVVTGLEINRERHKKAQFVKDILGYHQVNFVLSDTSDSAFWNDPENRFDVGFCFALIHRVSDPFNLIARLALSCETLIFEWKSPEGFISNRLSMAFHETQGLLDPKNINARGALLSQDNVMDSGLERPYWTMTSGALTQILKDFGFVKFETLKVSRMNILRVIIAYADLFFKVVFGKKGEPFSWRRSRRLIMVCSKSENFRFNWGGVRDIRRHYWDGTVA